MRPSKATQPSPVVITELTIERSEDHYSFFHHSQDITTRVIRLLGEIPVSEMYLVEKLCELIPGLQTITIQESQPYMAALEERWRHDDFNRRWFLNRKRLIRE